MARYVSHRKQVEQKIRSGVVTALYRTGFRVEGRAKKNTPVLSGNLKRSEHTVVVDEQGRVLRGGGADENGNAVPQYPATGHLTAYVGTNTGYGKWVEIGANGRPGKAMLGRAMNGVGDDLRHELSKVKA